MTYITTPRGLKRVPTRTRMIDMLCDEGQFILLHDGSPKYQQLRKIMRKMLKWGYVRIVRRNEDLSYLIVPTPFLYEYRQAVLDKRWTHMKGPVDYMKARLKYI